MNGLRKVFLGFIVALGLFSLVGMVIVAVLIQREYGLKIELPREKTKEEEFKEGLELARKEADRKLLADVVSHKFWKTRMTEADIEKMIATIQGLKQPDVFVVAESGKPALHKYDGYFEEMHRRVAQGRVVFVILSKFRSAPDRREILRELKTELDAADFRVGNGWLNPDKPKPPDKFFWEDD